MRKSIHVCCFIFICFVQNLMVGCVKSPSSPTTSQPGNLMFIHASPDATGLDVFADGTVVESDLKYNVPSAYLSVTPNTYAIQVTPTGTTNNLVSGNITIYSNSYYSLFIIDSLASIRATAMQDVLTKPSSDSAKIRFFQFSPDAPKLDVVVVGGNTLFGGRKFDDQDSVADLVGFAEIPAGNYSFKIQPTGTTNVLLTSASITLQGGRIYTLYTAGFAIKPNPQQPLSLQIITNL
jgi:hypothetical protein